MSGQDDHLRGIEPMLARLARAVPDGAYLYEPKWDGFRCLAFRSSSGVDLRSRNRRPFARYFPEVVRDLEAFDAVFVFDGELIAERDGCPDFPALLARLHPAAARVARLADETPATYMVFDILELNGDDLTRRPLDERRRVLDVFLSANVSRHVVASPVTTDVNVARRWLAASPAAGIDGVMAKPTDLLYEPGRRTMIKVKPKRTVDCVVAGLRSFVDGKPLVASLLLGLYDDGGVLRHVGVVSSFGAGKRAELFADLAPLAIPLERHPWRGGFALEGGPTGRLRGAAGRWSPDMTMDWLPLAPVRVCEVAYDQRDGLRFRHPARFKRWRPDRNASSCTVEQLAA